MLLNEGDVLILAGEPDALERAIAGDRLMLEGEHRERAAADKDSEIGVIEAVINVGSPLVGQTAGRLYLQARYGVNLIAISRRGHRLSRRLGNTELRGGDVVVLQGALELLPEKLRDLGCLPLAERTLRLGSPRRTLLPIVILSLAMIATAMGYVPVAVAFFAAAGVIMAVGALPCARRTNTSSGRSSSCSAP